MGHLKELEFSLKKSRRTSAFTLVLSPDGTAGGHIACTGFFWTGSDVRNDSGENDDQGEIVVGKLLIVAGAVDSLSLSTNETSGEPSGLVELFTLVSCFDGEQDTATTSEKASCDSLAANNFGGSLRKPL